MSVTLEQRQSLYADRLRIAAEWDAKREAAIEACGPGAESYGRWRFRDREGREPDVVIYCRSNGDGTGWHPSSHEAEAQFGRSDERTGFEFWRLGLFILRWESAFGIIENYTPTPPEVLQERAEKREQKKLEREAAAEDARLPLFVAQD
jgi:hypothetical protein